MDQAVAYMAGELRKGRVFRKADWGGGDMRVDLYVHGGEKKKKRRVSESADGAECDGEGPSVSQRQDSQNCDRAGSAVALDVARLTTEVAVLKKEIVSLKKTVKLLVRRVGRRRGRKRDSVKKKRLQRLNKKLELMTLILLTVAVIKLGVAENTRSTDMGWTRCMKWRKLGFPKAWLLIVFRRTRHHVYSQVGMGRGGHCGVLANVNPLSYIDGQGDSFEGDVPVVVVPGTRMARDTTTRHERSIVGVSRAAGEDERDYAPPGDHRNDGDTMRLKDLSFGVVTREPESSLCASDEREKHPVQTEDGVIPKETSVLGVSDVGGEEERDAEPTGDNIEAGVGRIESVTVASADEVSQVVLSSEGVSDEATVNVGSSVGISPRRPAERESNLAVLFLTKYPYVVPDIVPLVEDCDYRTFIDVLESSQEATHAKAGGKHDLNNKFFIELATSQEMLSATYLPEC
ncbi:unnamed protein product [Eruca vesicaria subsp. sativa]|uniref:Uncharacterized protein n=1 Tax=Eruca vesicaria subsp. sativa TaxID=29727 RepID=A0ABC8J766_ERUVS|nr:unnamed protein product [Eruca vesicaria subsp. sativa]